MAVFVMQETMPTDFVIRASSGELDVAIRAAYEKRVLLVEDILTGVPHNFLVPWTACER